MKNIIYLRGRRVGSSATQSFLKSLSKANLIDKFFMPGHIPVAKSQERCKKEMGERFWIESLKCVSVRNPYGNCVSIFLHKKVFLRPHEQLISPQLDDLVQQFRDHVKTTYREMQAFPSRIENCREGNWQWSLYALEDKPVADHFIFYEKPKEGLLMLCNKLGIEDIPTSVSKAIDNFAATSRKANNKYNYRDFYDEETRQMISELRSKEINYFNYSF